MKEYFIFILFLVFISGSVYYDKKRIDQGKNLNHLSRALIRGFFLSLISAIDSQTPLNFFSLFLFWASVFWIFFDPLLNMARGLPFLYPINRGSEVENMAKTDKLFMGRPIAFLSTKFGLLVFSTIAVGLTQNELAFGKAVGVSILSIMIMSFIALLFMDGKVRRWHFDNWVQSLSILAVALALNGLFAVNLRPDGIPEPEYLDQYSLPGLLSVPVFILIVVWTSRTVRKGGI